MSTAPAIGVVREAISLAVREVLLLPVWWYSSGFLVMVEWMQRSLHQGVAWLGVSVWMKNLFIPMYGDTSLAGRAISFGIRFVMVLGRGLGVVVWAMFLAVIFLAYLFVLPLLGVLFLLQFFGLLFT